MGFILVLVIGFITCGLWYGTHFLFLNLVKKFNMKELEYITPLLSGIIPAIVVCCFMETHPFHFSALLNWKMWGLTILTICITSIIILLFLDRKKEKNPKILGFKCVEAACMEVPQRIMMQSFVGLLLVWQDINVMWSIPINAIIWGLGLLVQAYITKSITDKETWIELGASILFSVGIGVVYQNTSFFLFPMLAHAAERYLTSSTKIDIPSPFKR